MLSRINGGDCCLSGIDLDSCRDPNTETLQGWAREVINRFATYTEMGNDQSRSGKAFRKGAALKAAGYSYDAMRDALLADEDPEIAEWARTKGLANGERELHRIYDNAGDNGAAHVSDGVSLDDFNAYMPMHSYIFTPAREMWPASSINAKIPPLIGENGKPISASAWLDRNKSVEQMTWAPGKPMLIEGKLIADGGWIDRDGVTCFNLYRPPIETPGDPALAGPWVGHANRVYQDYATHIINFLAQRVQQPNVKINHALVLGGNQGIGKDTVRARKTCNRPMEFRRSLPTANARPIQRFSEIGNPARERSTRPRRGRPLSIL
jgi:hypothetical protein